MVRRRLDWNSDGWWHCRESIVSCSTGLVCLQWAMRTGSRSDGRRVFSLSIASYWLRVVWPHYHRPTEPPQIAAHPPPSHVLSIDVIGMRNSKNISRGPWANTVLPRYTEVSIRTSQSPRNKCNWSRLVNCAWCHVLLVKWKRNLLHTPQSSPQPGIAADSKQRSWNRMEPLFHFKNRIYDKTAIFIWEESAISPRGRCLNWVPGASCLILVRYARLNGIAGVLILCSWQPIQSNLYYNKKAVLSQRWPRDARYISRSWAVVRYGHSKLSKMAAAAILDLFEP